MKYQSKQQLIVELQKYADRIKRVPTRAEFVATFSGTDYAIQKFFADNFTVLLKASKLESYNERRFIDRLTPEEKNIKSLHVALSESRADNKLMKQQIADLIHEARSSEALKKMIGVLKERDLSGKMKWMKPTKVKNTTGVPLLFLSDIHFDEVVMPEQIQGVNAYNRKIAVNRLQHTFNKTVQLLKGEIKNPKYDGIVLALGGDMLSGNIHEELAETNEAAVLQSCVKLIDILIHGIEMLKKEFGKVYVPCVVGNHGRLFKKPRAKNKVFDNYEWIVYTFIQRHFQDDPAVTVQIPDGPDIIFKVYGMNILMTHGDQFKGGAGISGIFTPLMLGMYRKQQKNATFKQSFDLMMCGHFHQLIMTQFLIINGSVKGYDEYADQQNFKPERPQQALMIIHPQLGITHQMPVFCDSYLKDKDQHQIFQMK